MARYTSILLPVLDLNQWPFALTAELTGNICSSCGIQTHIERLEGACPVQLNEGTIWGQGGIRTHDEDFSYQINSLDFSAN